MNKRIKELRNLKGYTAKELAEKCGCSESAISYIESGKRKPSYELLVKLAEVLETTVSYLTDGDAVTNVEPELAPYLETLRSSKQMRVLFDAASDATPDQLDAIVNMLNSFKKNN